MRKMFKVVVQTFEKDDFGFNYADLCIREKFFIFSQDEIEETVERISNNIESKIRQRGWFGGIFGQIEIEYNDEEDLHRRAFISIPCSNTDLMIVVDFIEA